MPPSITQRDSCILGGKEGETLSPSPSSSSSPIRSVRPCRRHHGRRLLRAARRPHHRLHAAMSHVVAVDHHQNAVPAPALSVAGTAGLRPAWVGRQPGRWGIPLLLARHLPQWLLRRSQLCGFANEDSRGLSRTHRRRNGRVLCAQVREAIHTASPGFSSWFPCARARERLRAWFLTRRFFASGIVVTRVRPIPPTSAAAYGASRPPPPRPAPPSSWGRPSRSAGVRRT